MTYQADKLKMSTFKLIADHHRLTSAFTSRTKTVDGESIELLERTAANPQTDEPAQVATPRHLLRKQIGLSLTLASVVLVINFTLFAWAISKTRNIDGTLTFFTGDCNRSKRLSITITVIINILSTLLLGASNNAAQYITAPTRSEIDEAHRWGAWLHIGTMSFHNLGYIAWKRVILWAVLLCSSLPLHLFWNSIVLETLSSQEYVGLVVTEDFLNPAIPYNQTLGTVGPGAGYANEAAVLHANSSQLTVLDNAACLKAYGPVIQSFWGNLLIVVASNTTGNWISTIDYAFQSAGNGPDWPCGPDWSMEPYGPSSCDVSDLLAHPDQWHLSGSTICEYFDAGGACENPSRDLDLPVQHCYAQRLSAEEHCSLELVPELLLVVIICNVLKVVCLSLVLFTPSSEPIATIGDAVSSFLCAPDNTTEDLGPITAREVRKRVPGRRLVREQSPTRQSGWQVKHKLWCQAVSLARWAIVDLLFLAAIFSLRKIPSLSHVVSAPTTSQILEGFGMTENSYLLAHANGSILANALFQNLGQAVASILYCFYNNVLTGMLLAAETHSFSLERGRKSLRTSFPLKGQRAAHTLQVPLRYAIPLLISMAVLHVFISQAVFLVKVNPYRLDGTLDTTSSPSSFMVSFDGLLATLVWSGVLILALHGLGLRKLHTKDMPLMCNNSRAISAACHPPRGDGNAANKPVAYGVLIVDGERLDRVGFSSNEVGRLQAGVVYHKQGHDDGRNVAQTQAPSYRPRIVYG